MTIEVINTSNNPLPQYQTPFSAGMDLYANLEKPIIIESLQRVLIPTGLFMAIPPGFEGQIRPRSGLALKQGITCLNTPGTIDSDYRGEVKVLLINLSNEIQTVNHGDRIAQLVIAPCLQAEWQQVTSLSETVRGEGGFGHTGVNNQNTTNKNTQ